MTTRKRLAALIPFAIFLSACGSDNQKVDLGDDGKPGATAQGLAAYQGTWDGYAEAYQFDKGSDRVRVTLDSMGNGTIRLGDAPEFAPYSNPKIGYPEGLPYTEETFFFSYREAHEGFAYPVLDASVEGGRLHFDFWSSDIIKPWCEAQTSYAQIDDVPSCNPGGNGFGQLGAVCNDPITEVLDCGFAKTCITGCSCDAQGCHPIKRFTGSPFKLDGMLENDGDTLVGTLVVLDGDANAPERLTIHLTR